MVLEFSPAVIRAMLSDEIALNSLDECHQCHLNGDKTALLSVLMTCGIYQAVIPDWAVDELIRLDENIMNGSVTDLNEFFGFIAEHKPEIKKRRKIEENSHNVYKALMEHRFSGGNFSAADGLSAVAESTKVPLRIVTEIYKKNKGNLQKLPKNKPEGAIAIINAFYDDLSIRRRGRPTLKD
jgi:hypothetical protein